MDGRPEGLVLVLLVLAGVASGFGSGPILADERSPALTVSDPRADRVVHYDFDAGNASRVPNQAGTRYHGSVRGDERNVSYVPGKRGQALRFDGYPGHVPITSSSSLDTRRGVTFAFWIRLDGEQEANFFGDYGSYYFFVAGRTVVFVTMKGDRKIAQPRAEIPVGEWTFVVGTYDPERGAQIFVNDDLRDTKVPNVRPSSPSEDLILNMNGWKTGLSGSIDEFSLWNRSMSREDVRALDYRGRTRAVDASPAVSILLTALLVLVLAGGSLATE